MIVDVGGGGYDTAASALFGGNHVGAINYNTLTGKLGGFAAMAGDDTTSEEFAREYDVAAKDAVDGMNDLVDAFATLGVLTATSIENHRNANAGSVYSGMIGGEMVTIRGNIIDGVAKIGTAFIP